LAVPYGVVETNEVMVQKITEKPVVNFLVNAGIYLLEPKIIEIIPAGQKLDMTDLIDISIAQGLRVVSFPIVEYWLDVGTPLDYERANEEEVNES